MPKIHPRADHVGSLLRPQSMIDRLAEATNSDFSENHATDFSLAFAAADQELIAEITEEFIRDAVRKQEATGIGTITDGEFRRAFFMGSLDQAVSGFAPNPAKIEFHNEEQSVELEGRPIVVDRLATVATPGATEATLVASLTDRPVKITFPAASSLANPGMWAEGVTDQHYGSFPELAMHLGEILREQVDAAIAAGATYVQFDYPSYPLLIDPRYREMIGAEHFDEALQGSLMADRFIVQGLPDHVTTGLHLCRGNFRNMWMVDGPLDQIADEFFSLPYDNFLIEWDQKSRTGDYSALKGVPKGGPTVAMGLVSTKTGQLESEDKLVREIEQAAQLLDVDQLALCPQCGFASEIAGNALSEDDQWRKLELTARVAQRVWG